MVDPHTGAYLHGVPGTGGGINPHTGEFQPGVNIGPPPVHIPGGGAYNPQTGEYYPGPGVPASKKVSPTQKGTDRAEACALARERKSRSEKSLRNSKHKSTKEFQQFKKTVLDARNRDVREFCGR